MKWIIGIDEVGRGALAGPVVVAAALVPHSPSHTKNAKLGSLKDSKKLSVQKREAWFKYFKGHPKVQFAVARVYPRNIERLNISAAANVAAGRACERLIKESGAKAGVKVFLDGGLFLGNGRQPKYAKTVIRGDEKIHAVAIASIVAKVSRDRAMTRFAKKYAAYGLDIHKGYGTKLHRDALRKHGAAAIHRSTFLKKMALS
jgi:ribonuclease HII